MRQILAVLLICSVALSHATTTADDAKEFGRGFFGAFGADIDNCLGDDELAKISAKIDDIKHDWDQGSFVQKLLHTAEDVYGFSQLLRQQGQLCHVAQIETLFKGFFEAVKDQGFMNLFPKIMEEHMTDIMTDIQEIAEGVKEKEFRTVGSAFANLWQALFDSTSGPSVNVFSDDSIAAFIKAFDASIFDDAKDFAQGFFGGFGADMTKCLDDSDVQTIIDAFNNIKSAAEEKGIKKFIGIAEGVWNFVQNLREQLKSCQVTTIESEIKSFAAALKADGAKAVLLEFAEQHLGDTLRDVKNVFEGLKTHNYQTVGQSAGDLLNDLLTVATPTAAFAAPTPNSAGLEDAKEFLQGFFTNFGATVDSCIDDNDLANMKNAIDEIKAAASAHGLMNKIKGMIEGIETLANLLKAQAHNCNVTTLESTIANFIAAVKNEGIEKVALEAVLHHGLSLIGDGKTLYEGIKSKNYNEMGMATGAILNDIMDEQFEFFYIGYTSATTVEDAKNFAQGFFSSFGADVTKCLDNNDMTDLVNDIDSLKAAFKSKKIGEIISSGISVYSDIKDQSDKCDVKQVPELVKTFITAVKQDGIERVLVNAIAINFKGLVSDAKNLIAGFGKKDFVKIGAGFGGLMNHIMGADTPYLLDIVAPVAADADIVADAKTLLQGFFNAWGADISKCLDDSDFQKFADLVDSVRDAWKSGPIVQKLEKTVLAVYSAWNLIQQEAGECKITQIEQAIETFSAAVKTNGWKKVLMGSLEAHAMDLLTDGEQVMSGIKSHNYELVGQAVGNVIRDALDVQTTSALTFVTAEPDAMDDAKTVLQGFFNAWGADISKCLDDNDFQKFANLIDSVKQAWKSGSVVQKLEKTVLAGYAAWNLIQEEAGECKITQIEQAVETFTAAVKAHGWESTLLGAIKAHAMDLLADGQQIVSGIKSHNYELLGQALGNVLRSALDVQSSSSVFFVTSSETTIEDAKDFAQGFFSTFGADVSKCLDDNDFNSLVTDIDNLKTAFKSKNIGQIVAAGIATFSDVKDQASKCDVKALPALVKQFIGAVKEDGIERVLANAVVINAVGLIKDAKNLITGITKKDFVKIGTGVGGLMNHIMGVDSPSVPKEVNFFAASKTSEAEDFARGFFESFGADVSQCLDSADMDKVQSQIDDIKKAIKSNPVEALVVIVKDVTAIVEEFKTEAQQCDISKVEDLIKSVIAAAKDDGADKYILSVLLEHGLDMLTKVKTGVDAFKAEDFEGAGKAIGGIMEDLKPNEAVEFLAGFLA